MSSYAKWTDCTGHFHVTFRMTAADGWWPPMAHVEVEDDALTLTVDDLRSLAAKLIEYAELIEGKT